MRKISVLIGLAAGLFLTEARADFTGKDASNVTITFKNPNTCSGTPCVPMSQPYDGTNTITFTTAGANGVSNTLTGMPTYDRMHVYNGTTWDRWQGAVTLAASAAADGWDATQGAKGDTVCATDTGTCSIAALMKKIAANLTTLNTTAGGSIPAGAALIGDVNLRQGGTVLSTSNPAFFRPTDGTNGVVFDPCQVVAKTNFTGSQTASTQIIPGTSAKKTYICSMHLVAAAAEIVNIIAGTGSVCATGSSVVMGSTTVANGMSYAANGGFTLGNGAATVMQATAVNADNVCLTQSGGSRVTYQGTYVQL
jgi:hypothetical protein